MYLNDKVVSSSFDIMDEIEDNDIFNSKFIYLLSSVPSNDYYQINKCPERLDLILMDKYNTNDNYGLNYVYNRFTDNQNISKGRVIKLVPPDLVQVFRSKL